MNYSLEMVLAATLLTIGATTSFIYIRDRINQKVEQTVEDLDKIIDGFKPKTQVRNQDIQEATTHNESHNRGQSLNH